MKVDYERKFNVERLYEKYSIDLNIREEVP